MTRARAERRGRRAESIAALFLRLKGWSILDRRVRNPRGEIDLVARRGKVVALVEVKWRAKELDLATAIDSYRLRRVAAAGEAVAHRYCRAGDTIRVDVLLLAPGRWPRHITNAWQP